jgi:hypothetical protein
MSSVISKNVRHILPDWPAIASNFAASADAHGNRSLRSSAETNVGLPGLWGQDEFTGRHSHNGLTIDRHFRFK